jgi:hypothetical protein
MSKKSQQRREKRVPAGRGVVADAAPFKVPRRGGWIKRFVIALLIVATLLTAAIAATRYEPVRRAVGLHPLLVEPAAQGTGSLPLSKEYVYAGGRLVATEEATPTPTPTPAGPPPTGLVATLSAVNAPAASISVTWVTPSSGPAVVASYIVERASVVGQFAPIGQPVTGTSFNDTDAHEGMAYLYHVRAVFTNGGMSADSNADLVTAVAFTDDPLVGTNDPQQRPATIIRARHLTELHRAVDAVRVLAGIGGANWKNDPTPQTHGSILKDHFLELRTNLNPALPLLGKAVLPEDASLAVNLPVKVAHIQDVRDKVK